MSFETGADKPQFKERAKHLHIDEKGYVLYYTSQCPFHAKFVPVLEQTAQENDITFHTIHDREYITNEQMNNKKFLKLINGQQVNKKEVL